MALGKNQRFQHEILKKRILLPFLTQCLAFIIIIIIICIYINLNFSLLVTFPWNRFSSGS